MATSDVGAPQRRSATSLLLLACGASFLAVLDVTVVNLAMPDLREDFTDSVFQSLSWVITIYAIVFAALLAPAGRLADALGRRTIFLAGISVFTAASLLCAVAPNLDILLVARAIQGIGAAAMIPASLAIVLMDTPPERRRAAIGQWSAAAALAAAVGPAVGGVLVDSFGWRSLFLINIPFGLLFLYGAAAIPRTTTAPGTERKLPDVLGTIMLGAGVGLFCLGISKGSEWGWTEASSLLCVIVGPILIALCLLRSAKHPAPALEVSLWRNRTFALANAAAFFYGIALFSWLLVGVLYVTQVWGYSELEAGLAMTPGAFAATIVAMRVGKLPPTYGPRLATAGGAVILAGTGFLLAFTLPDHSMFLAYWLPLGVLAGIGMGAITTGTSTAAALSVSPLRFAGATGLNQTARQIGGAIGIAILATVVSGALKDIADFERIYLIAACAATVVALLGLGLTIKLPPAPPAATPPEQAAGEQKTPTTDAAS
ncbi:MULTISPECIES: DHA2 family efflux MFS transporter permease subunit [unclassified Streptomyces]|uniref:DHA2 family efflux MFS transporter permease subunit n=1 Tax=unclassified Streptomyces TaxID=2593676 RepID=UPI00093CD512|nr:MULTISPECIES: DHA2 family efflux MFS transporter permease subunit [unclassified Streptomyces]MBT2381576.1 DHA2 family efflux MFS transporter permease subunit [Streptomyces sp. ISL-111]MBT2429025.1 DHA2 family efflux MFS transporter permease subunit [Streptomyces sp. ISL-112]MBT2464077.1 DHA2 family efflux MFS transporter permease subunit [Streptomyces sp. ISL-63]